MNIEINSTLVLAILMAVIICYLFMTSKKEQENWTLLEGGSQKWDELPRESSICDTGFYDDECKFSAVNCLKNPNSAFYNNE
jgi:hypothetical protein